MSLRKPSLKQLHSFKEDLVDFYNEQPKYDMDHLFDCFTIYFNFLKIFGHPKLTLCNANQMAAYKMALVNYESFWWRTRRGGKTIGMSVLEVFYSLIEFGDAYPGQVVHRCPSGDQLRMLYYWFNKNPLVQNINQQTHFVDVIDSEPIWASMTTKDNSDGYGCSVLFEDEWGTIHEDELKAEYLDSTREFILEGHESGKRHFHASTLHYGSVGAKDMIFLEELGMESGQQYVHVMPWWDCPWIKQQSIDKEKRKHFDNPSFIKEMFECILVPRGGLFFNAENWCIAGQSEDHPEITLEWLSRYPIKQAGWDFNGQDVGHIEERGFWDHENQVIIVKEEKAWDKTKDIHDHILSEQGIVSHEVEGVPKADGYNAGFTQNLLELGTPCRFQKWIHTSKQRRIAILQNAFIIVHPDCKWLIKNLQSSTYDKTSIIPKMHKTTFQHGIDGAAHLVHTPTGRVDIPEYKQQSSNPYETLNEELWS